MAQPINSTQFITAVLEAEFGGRCVPQIGVFTSTSGQVDELPVAQQVFAGHLVSYVENQLENHLDKPLENHLSVESSTADSSPHRILVVGAALSGVAAKLAMGKSAVVWIAEPQTSSKYLHPDTPMQVLTGTVFNRELHGGFAGILYGDTFHYLDQLPLLTRFRELLNPGGQLWIASEFLQDDSIIQASSLANLSSHTQLSMRLGFHSRQVTDYSEAALLSVSLFRQLLQRHAASVKDGLGLDEDTLARWQDVFATMEQELGTGRRCFQLHHWQLHHWQPHQRHLTDSETTDTQSDHERGSLGEYALAEYGDISTFAAPEIANLFEQSFDKPFDPALWHWKYQLGGGKCVVARIDRGGDIVAHYGGAPRQISYFGEPGMAIQVCDVMVLPEKRRQYGKSSLFFKVAATFLEREIGNSVNHLLGFGFPNQGAMNIAIRLGLYEKTDDFMEVVFPSPQESTSDVDVLAFEIDDAAHREAIELLWAQMQGDFTGAIIGQRHPDYIRYRYFDHPGSEHYNCKLLRARSSGEMLAFFVLKPHGQAQLLLDMICPMQQVGVLISAANQWVKLNSHSTDLRMWLTRGWLSALPTQGATVNELGIEIPCNSWNPGPDAATLYGKWWLTAGDMDFM